MEKKTLKNLFAEKLFQIPDYQRGYAWEEKQWKDFIQDIDALVDKEVNNHYTGTIVIYQQKNKPLILYGSTDKLELVDVVDGQQRLTTCCLYLSIIIKSLVEKSLSNYEPKKSEFLFSGNTCKLTLNNDTKDIFLDLLKKGQPNSEPQTPHQKRLHDAYLYFKKHVDNRISEYKEKSTDYLENLYDAIIRKLNFTFYTIEEECEIGMTFELMNSRGKGLSILEQLKNYLMYWISRNARNEAERKDITGSINKNWKEIYINIGKAKGNEDQCLRIAWTLYCTHTPKNWKGYEGFKDIEYIPLRDFSKKDILKTKEFIIKFSDGLAEISRHYAVITNPLRENTKPDEFVWLSKIHNTGNIANFLPLLIATRKQYIDNNISSEDYIELLKALECYAYRVFLIENKRSNAGISSFFEWGNEVFEKKYPVGEVKTGVYALINFYSNEDRFEKEIETPSDWYNRRALRYTLFEYELDLLKTEGKNQKPKLEWNDLKDSTMEHILPQTPKEDSEWNKKWGPSDFNTYLHDIGNLVLTENNSNYLNFDFERKKGKAGRDYCYANSDIRQERKLAEYSDWTLDELKKRRDEITKWIKHRWGIISTAKLIPVEMRADENDEE